MIKTTLGELVEAEQVLVRLSSKEGFPYKVIYAIAKMMRLVKTETKIWYGEREKLFDKLGAKKDATSREILPDNFEEFQKLLKELNSIEVTINWNPIKSDTLIDITASDLINLGPLCELVEPSDG
jgi:hypothetical protein